MPLELRNYHVILSDGTERNIKARASEIEKDGTLIFSNGKEMVVAYANGAWKMVEVERQDDKG